MPGEISLDEAAHEGGTFAIDVSFTDELGADVIPKAGLNWSLVKEDGVTIVNNREEVVITSPAATVTIVLSGVDLALDSGKLVSWRYLVVEGTYDSSLGSNLPLKDHVKFPIVNIAKVPL
jgi:hypothetical protein